MKLGSTDIPGGRFTGETPSAKQAIHNYDWSDESAVTDMGSGPTILVVACVTMTLAERLAVIAACNDARSVETNLYFASELGQTDDYYYRVQTSPARLAQRNSTTYEISFNCIALVPYIYDADTGERVT